MEGYFYMKSIFDVKWLYWNEFIANFEKFKLNAFMSSIINSKWQFCFGMGFENEDIKFGIEMEQKMIDCYKTLLHSFCVWD